MLPVEIDELQRDVRSLNTTVSFLNDRVKDLEQDNAKVKDILAHQLKIHEETLAGFKIIREAFADLGKELH